MVRRHLVVLFVGTVTLGFTQRRFLYGFEEEAKLGTPGNARGTSALRNNAE